MKSLGEVRRGIDENEVVKAYVAAVEKVSGGSVGPSSFSNACGYLRK